MSIQTKQAAPALSALSKAKGQKAIMTVAQPAVIMDTKATPVPATPAQAPDAPVTPATVKPEPAHGRDYEQSWKELKTYHDKTVYELRQEKTRLEEQLANAAKPELKLPKTKDEVKKWREQYPEAGDIIVTLASELIDGKTTELNRKLQAVNELVSKTERKEAFAELMKIHPDAEQIKTSPEFAEWFNRQPAEIKNILSNSRDIPAVAKQITLFKLEVLGINPKEKAKAKTEEAKEASLGVTINSHTEIGSAKRIWTKSEIDYACSDYNRWNKVKDEIDAARREGRVDMTK